MSHSISRHTLYSSPISTAHTLYHLSYLFFGSLNYTTNFFSIFKRARSSKFSNTYSIAAHSSLHSHHIQIQHHHFPCLQDKYEIDSVIGHGSFSCIYKARVKGTNQSVAIKRVHQFARRHLQTWQMIKRELEITLKLAHRNIPKFFEVIEDTQDVFLVMEYLSGGSLLEYANKNGRLHEPAACEIFWQLIDCLDYLHNTANVVHRDIKAENIMFDRAMVPKFIDFGFAREVEECTGMLCTMCGSPNYVSPEMLKERKYDKGTDIWSLGIVLYAIVAGRLPFVSQNHQDLVNLILTKDPVFPKWFSANLRDLLSKMLEKDATKRISIAQIKGHPWMMAMNSAGGIKIDRSLECLPRLSPIPKVTDPKGKEATTARRRSKQSLDSLRFPRKMKLPKGLMSRTVAVPALSARWC